MSCLIASDNAAPEKVPSETPPPITKPNLKTLSVINLYYYVENKILEMSLLLKDCENSQHFKTNME
jgi:pyrroloquinoline quinone (PQQ) biosynthesis protein C